MESKPEEQKETKEAKEPNEPKEEEKIENPKTKKAKEGKDKKLEYQYFYKNDENFWNGKDQQVQNEPQKIDFK